MSESKRADKRRISRRAFLRRMTGFSVAALAGASLLEACSPPPATPTPAPTAPPSVKPSPASATLSDALKKRKSATAFQPQPLPKEKLLDLLWAAWGINRPDSGKRTAPSAMNAQEIDIYVLTSEGAFVYDAKANQLTAVVAQDLRAKATTAAAMRDAAAQLIFVADYAKLRTGSQSQKELYSACHTGFIAQNVYLYCAVEGLGARFYAGVDRAALKESLKLRNDQQVVFAQAVGYSKE